MLQAEPEPISGASAAGGGTAAPAAKQKQHHQLLLPLRLGSLCALARSAFSAACKHCAAALAALSRVRAVPRLVAAGLLLWGAALALLAAVGSRLPLGYAAAPAVRVCSASAEGGWRAAAAA